MSTNTLDSIQPMMMQLSESNLIKVKEYLKKLLSNSEDRVERYNPFTALSREEIIQQLAIARKHAEEGKVMDAHQASANVRAKYGLK